MKFIRELFLQILFTCPLRIRNLMYMYVENRVATIEEERERERKRLLLYYYYCYYHYYYYYCNYRSRLSIHIVKVGNEYVTSRLLKNKKKNFCRLDQYSLDLPETILYSHLV